MLLSTIAAKASQTAQTTPRGPSLASRFLTDFVAAVQEANAYAQPLRLDDAAKSWCADNYPANDERKTPVATLMSQLHVLAKANALPQGISLQTARENSTMGLQHRATITVARATETPVEATPLQEAMNDLLPEAAPRHGRRAR